MSKLGLRLTANDAKFRKGLLKLICQASLILVYEYETSQTLSGGTQPRNKILVTSGVDQVDHLYSASNNNNENTYAHYLRQIVHTTHLPELHSKQSLLSDQNNQYNNQNSQDESSDVITWKNDPLLLLKVTRDAPLITGGKEKYRVGSILNVNCSSAPDAHLSWLIKNKPVNILIINFRTELSNIH